MRPCCRIVPAKGPSTRSEWWQNVLRSRGFRVQARAVQLWLQREPLTELPRTLTINFE